MKKLNLALALGLLATTSATNAATIYEGKGLKYTVKGDIQVQLLQKYGMDRDLDVNYDDAELKNNVTYDLGNGTKAFAQVDYDFHKESVDETYVGLNFSGTKVWIGDSDYATDAFGIEKNIDVNDIDGDSFVRDESDELIGLEFSAGKATIAMTYDLEVGDDEETSLDLFASIPAGPVELQFAYQALENIENEDDGLLYDFDTVGIAASTKFSGMELGLSYSSTDTDSPDAVTDNISAALSFPLAPTLKGTLGYDINEFDSGDDINIWYANIVYKFPTAKKVSLFAEIANSDEDDSDVGYLVGMRVKF